MRRCCSVRYVEKAADDVIDDVTEAWDLLVPIIP
jgi:hypothetical protein